MRTPAAADGARGFGDGGGCGFHGEERVGDRSIPLPGRPRPIGKGTHRTRSSTVACRNPRRAPMFRWVPADVPDSHRPVHEPPDSPDGGQARRVAAGALTQQIAQVTGLVVLLAVVTVLARRLSLAELGTYGLTATLATYLLIVKNSHRRRGPAGDGGGARARGAVGRLHHRGGAVRADRPGHRAADRRRRRGPGRRHPGRRPARAGPARRPRPGCGQRGGPGRHREPGRHARGAAADPQRRERDRGARGLRRADADPGAVGRAAVGADRRQRLDPAAVGHGQPGRPPPPAACPTGCAPAASGASGPARWRPRRAGCC